MRISSKTKTTTADDYLLRVNRVIDHVMRHLDSPDRLTSLAKIAKLSPFHFHRVFQMLVGETPADFVKRLRLQKALSLMASQSTRSLTDIALSCGFASSSDFSRSFRQRFGTSPRSFDLAEWRVEHSQVLEAMASKSSEQFKIDRLPSRTNPDKFRVRLCELPKRRVAYIRVTRPYEGDRVLQAAQRLQAWADRRGFGDGQWLGYQWENPEITALKDCCYYVAVEASEFRPAGEIGAFEFPALTVADIEIHGSIELELRALQWLYGSWLPRSRFVPADEPCFEAWTGRPFAHGVEKFELNVQLPLKRGV